MLANYRGLFRTVIFKGSWYRLTKGEHQGTFNSCSVASVQEYPLFTPARSLQDCSYLDELRYQLQVRCGRWV